MKLKFKINKRLDIQMAYRFYNYKYAGIDFGANITRTLSHLKNPDDIPKQVNLFYKNNLSKLETKMNLWQKNWNKIEEKYFSLVEKLFNQKWPKGKYVCYISIFDCNPRFLIDKTFQGYYKTNAGILIAHELLHFMFYDYFNKHFKNKLRENRLWDLSEVFNVILLNQKPLQKLLGYKEIPYPEHKKLYQKLNKLYETNRNIGEFIREAIKWA